MKSTDDRADNGTMGLDGETGATPCPGEPTSAADWPIELGALPVLSPEAYHVGPEVGSGGMGSVARAVDRRLGRVVALKQLIRPSDSRRTRFAREAQLTARLQHPSIVRVYEAGAGLTVGWPTL